jgi:hypothetical membrane protein
MKRTTELIQSGRNSLGENLALSFAIPVALGFAVIWGIVFYTQHMAIGLVGWPSIGSAVLINAAIIAFIGFILGYLRGQKALRPEERLQLSKPKFIFDCLTLSIAYTIISVVLTAVVVYAISEAFKGVTMTSISAAMVVAAFAAVTVYSIINTSVHLQSGDIVNALTLFIAGGVYASMATAQNPYWWQINFSSLGTTTSISSLTFNVTLILSGLLLLCLTDHLLADLAVIIKGEKSSANIRIQTIKFLFVFISLSLAGVGLFPWNRYPLLHNASAYLLVVVFSVIIIGLRWLMPTISKSFLANSYTILVTLLISFAMWRPLHYFNQTAFELIAFSLTFVWLVLFLRTITLMRQATLAKRA